MAKLRVDDLKNHSNKLFDKQRPVISLFQTLAEHFYPQRADFTVSHNTGEELASNLLSSYPLLVARELGDSLSAMLRTGHWFDIGTNAPADHDAKQWLQWATLRYKMLIDNRLSGFTRATKQGDHDFTVFGQTVISVERNRMANGLLHQNWHMKDVAWRDNEYGMIDNIARKSKPCYKDMVGFFGEGALHKNVTKDLHKDYFKEGDIRHIVMPAEHYGDDELASSGMPFVSVFLDMQNDHIIEELAVPNKIYCIPRFQTIAGSPYAYSPATVAGLPDARVIQAMTHTLMEAAERYARPPILATQKAIRGDVDLSADGITWLDDEYDEKKGAALRTLEQDRGGYPIGMDMFDRTTQVLSNAFYLNKIKLPLTNKEMTAYEVSELMKQYRRENLPLFSPIEADYNGQLCEMGFEIALQNGFLGSPYDIPQSLQDTEIEFEFKSPIKESEEEHKVTQFHQTAQLLAEAAEHDQGIKHNVNFDVALRDALAGMGTPQKWLKSVEEVMGARQLDGMQQAALMAQEMGVAPNA